MDLPIVIDLKKTATDPSLSAFVRVVAQHLVSTDATYAHPSELLKLLSDTDLELMVLMAERSADDAANQYTRDLALFACILAQAEGVDVGTMRLNTQFTYLCTVLTLASLARKGLITLHDENISFDDSDQTLDKPLASQTPEMRERSRRILTELGFGVHQDDSCDTGDDGGKQ